LYAGRSVTARAYAHLYHTNVFLHNHPAHATHHAYCNLVPVRGGGRVLYTGITDVVATLRLPVPLAAMPTYPAVWRDARRTGRYAVVVRVRIKFP